MLKEDCTSTNSQEEVISKFLSYYSGLHCLDVPVLDISPGIINKGSSISEEDYRFLYAPIEDESIREALFHIEDDKAPGLDGYTAAFFKAN